MQIAVITPVPEVIDTLIQNSILRKAVEKNVVEFHLINLRDFGKGNYRQIDDSPFGGGSGMVLMAEPIFKAIEYAMELVGGPEDVRVIYPSPQGKTWDQRTAEETSQQKKFIVICGHYKGIDERVIEKFVTHEYSLGDFVMTGGEIPAMVMLDSAVRLIPGTLNTLDSALTDSFSQDLLDHPHYTQPREIDGLEVPKVLLGGHHANIEAWRQEKKEERTKEKRPDLWEKFEKLNESE
ncbi:MAG: tRNA (guanosine(37)-N1)-methyltransferase TrmD [Candidatus Marinimicrobia bacterium]|nr:tRNA (guanosine(37)-N1)-methyltransferase TrmD [Candidatus Neomarinimicrobiota bacterium]MBT3518876.1 tRNA (guanosine(37)-N1)-methyltransferase TrmD [Candidatus Neomarinimicrobiota bacterium]MBT3946313.1 tRNA (guanosine(37)-N1)-methyltransferase TrmD [Candidatus Neomarinimicrobiota bacterium]MBT4155364.1 tRNA (guanosine(37)-N1)-methyltransferase TrmD [Candidatus Neomarinimicrobiota bacterium]MBT4554714.1 tRNA (guanosine(37)-N1)-methyltransferase TrmD [Candidatus Neomarinimicrobiota bacterium